jgi:hypothetical protein
MNSTTTLLAGIVAVTMLLSSNNAFSKSYFKNAATETESLNNGMQLCLSQSKKPERCKAVKVTRGSKGSYRVIVRDDM